MKTIKNQTVIQTITTPESFSSFSAPEIKVAGGKFSVLLTNGNFTDAKWVFETLGKILDGYALENPASAAGVRELPEVEHQNPEDK